ncbi:ASCH domain-containing protein [Alteromonas oceanisediminis]|uniref:ASCH domain-containing protein n=1 Tax=Alteromonas oceanisediminis TaxID=2836180 RepID=UPI001BD95285|nr:ASCH domain-containing protein [Alteromonas oceanisediminis]MBT0587050.1 ASCH domain-containing protein [Alteromonas oceanisediminis]
MKYLTDAPQAVLDFWQDFLSTKTGQDESFTTRFYEWFHFDDNEEDAMKWAAMALAGRKRGTASLLDSYIYFSKPLPNVGSLSIVTDWHSNPIAIIETTNIDIQTFANVSEEFAMIEGEGDGTLQWWRKSHWRYFQNEAKSFGFEFSHSTKIVCEQFKVIFKRGLF